MLDPNAHLEVPPKDIQPWPSPDLPGTVPPYPDPLRPRREPEPFYPGTFPPEPETQPSQPPPEPLPYPTEPSADR